MLNQDKSYQLSSRAAELYRRGKYEEAEKCAFEALEYNKKNHDALQVLGNVFFIGENYFRALGFYHRVLRLFPKDTANLFNIANTFFQLKAYRKSVLWGRKVLTLDGFHFEALCLLGQCYLEMENFSDSIACFRKALSLNKQDFWVWNYLGQALQKNGCNNEALEASLRAVELSGGEDSQQINFAYALYEAALEGGIDSIREYLNRWQEKYAENEIVSYVFKSFVSDGAVFKSDIVYVRKIFDVFASDFENVLSGLDYVVPQIISCECAEYCREEKIASPMVLDIGCGTGLCGKFLASLLPETQLSGVDISSEMLHRAKMKKIYKSLFCEDVERFLQKGGFHYDVIIAGDVLTYIGKLENIFANVVEKLRENGFFIFSITKNTVNENDWFLTMSGRFCHSEKYIENLISENGFVLRKKICSKLRNEGDTAVWGWIFSIQKKAS